MTHRVEESLTDTQIIRTIESVQERLRERNYVSEPESQVISSTGTRIIHRLIDTGEDEGRAAPARQPVESIVKTRKAGPKRSRTSSNSRSTKFRRKSSRGPERTSPR